MRQKWCLDRHASPHARRYPHDIKGEGIYAYVVLHQGESYGDAVRKDLVKTVREQIGAFAAPDVIHWTPGGCILANSLR